MNTPLRETLQILLLVVAISVLLFMLDSLLKQHEQPVSCYRCNVILISIDTLGAKHTSLHNRLLNTTPFLQKLSTRNTTFFSAAYAQAPWTLPSHAAMLTGKYPWDLGIHGPADILSTSTTLISELLRENGYATAAISTGPFVQPRWNLSQGFDTFRGTQDPESAWNDANRIIHDATVWLSENRHSPFFLFIHTFHPHDPYGDGPDAITIRDIVKTNLSGEKVDPALNDDYMAAYRQEIEQIDAALKSFFTYLSRSGLSRNTIVIITSDHGEEFNEHGTTGFHSVTLHNEVLHVPLLITVPRSASNRIDAPVEIRSIPGTILELTGQHLALPNIPSLLTPVNNTPSIESSIVKSATNIERNSLLHTLANGYLSAIADLSAQTSDLPIPSEERSVIIGSMHGILKRNGTIEVYDMESDPDEQRPLSSTSTKLSATAQQIIKTLNTWDTSTEEL